MRGLLPECVALQAGDIAANTAPIWPAEEARVLRAVASRAAEFAAGRSLARRALAMLGGPDCALPAGPDGAPEWPAGYVGSIAHSGHQAMAAVARQGDVRALGIDFEIGIRFKPAMEPMVLRVEEIAELPAGAGRAAAATVRFCAKEAFYKMQYPLTRQRLHFQDARVVVGDAENFTLVLLTPAGAFAAGAAFVGRYLVAGDQIAAAMWLL